MGREIISLQVSHGATEKGSSMANHLYCRLGKLVIRVRICSSSVLCVVLTFTRIVGAQVSDLFDRFIHHHWPVPFNMQA